ncbi:MAG: isopentenyl phosphate kinase [Candidatus Bathyarchaeia archaeon]|nr:isopentenyl phosphate kinase family protein [Candidatus Bathyarchaeota archaeon]
MKGELIIIKLGGSVITFKDRPFTPNVLAIKRLAREITESKASPLIIVHGGGSFGHTLAAEYGIAGGLKGGEQMLGFSKTHNAMVRLNMLVVEALLDEGLPAVSFSPSSFIITRRGRIQSLYMDALEQALKSGFIPVLYGDAVLDYAQGSAILSGDQIAARLAVEFDARRVIFGVDVDGLYTSDPKVVQNARLITEITVEDLKGITASVGGARASDVTGGMMGKILEIIDLVSRGIEVLIINALRENNIYRALRGESVVGTRIIGGKV